MVPSDRRVLVAPTLLLVVGTSFGCAHAPPATAPVAAAEAPILSPALDGLWVGQARTSPLGSIPYAWMVHEESGTFVAETPAPPGGTLPPGAYQRFTFTAGAPAQMTFRATLGQGDAAGSLVATPASRPAHLVFCASEGCARMQVDLVQIDPDDLTFTTRIDGDVHADISLARRRARTP